ncbi:CPBP family glutamic-type intramembrane protease [Microlunatus speluncae]|uniref:CPBP family glutamic-type intramembrane protease n=1 Tax=Microlunatus speluncae TaxID=2594267 RepID=UPI00126609E8|nr:CPBP family glutamic-type intramembrane protease [Microlunatus speluncae]
MTGRPSWKLTLGRALGAMIIFTVALGAASGIGLGVANLMGWPRTVASLIQAALCTVIALAGIGWLARITRSAAEWYGFRRTGIGRDLLLGFGVVAAAAVVVIGPTAALGGLRFDGVDPGPLLLWLGTTVIVATGLEAFPEELAFRGMAYSSLLGRLRPFLAAAVATVIFVLAPGLATFWTALIMRLLRAGEPPWYSLAPEGQDPITYLMLLTLWSICLIQARQVTGRIWVGVAAHLTLLIINRTLLGSATGSGVSLAQPDLMLIIPGYVILATIGFAVVRGRRLSRTPEPAR